MASTMLTRLIITGCFLLAMIGCASGPPVGATAPTFDAIDANGDQVSLASYDDQVLILYFFGFW